MNCANFQADLALYVEGDLTSARSAMLDEHIASCEKCGVLAGELRQSQAEIRGLRNEVVDAAALHRVRANVLQEIQLIEAQRTWLNRMAIRLRTTFRWRYAAFGVVAIAIVLAAVWGPRVGSPPKLGGVAAPPRKCCEASLEGADGVVPKTYASTLRVRNHPAPLRASPLLTQEGSPPAPINLDFQKPIDDIDSQKEDVVVKILTDDPNIVIYWLLDQKTGGF
jgi:hypothetical protein